MLKMVDGTGIIGVDMICLLGVSTPQPPNYDRVELEGAGMLVLPNSLDAPLERLELGGKTEQVQTSGKQLFDAKNAELNKWVGSTGIIATVGRNCIFRLNVKPNTVYQVNILSASSTFSFSQFSKENVFLERTVFSKGTKSFKCTTTEDVDYAYFLIGDTVDNINGIINDVMLYEGEEYKNYEPYTGGKPSPSPEYPQEIKSVGKWNDEKQKYEVDVKVTGKNLLNLQKEPDVKGVYQGWKVGNGESLTLGVKDKGNNADVKGCYIGFSYQGSESNGVVWVVDNGVIKTNPLTQRKAYVSIFPANETTVKKLTERLDIQCELGNVATPYQPYKEQTLTLTSDRPLTKWDRLVEQGGEIGWLYGSVIATIDETASISLYAPNGFYVYVKNIDKKEKTGYCDKLYAKKMSNGEPFVLFGNANNNGLYTLNTQEFYGKTVSEIKEKLKEYPLNIIGKSETTEFVPLPQSEQNAIRALKAYYPTTVITVDGGELDPDIKVTYRKEK